MKPLDPRLLREARAARWFITGVVALAALGVAATIVIAWNLTRFVTGVFIDGQSPVSLSPHLVAVALAGVIKGLAIWLQEVWATRAAAASRAQLRRKYLEAISLGSRAAGANDLKTSAEKISLATRGLDALDAYFSRYLPQLVLTVIATPVLGIVIWLSDWSSGLILTLTLPLIPLFMVMIGWATRSVQQRQLSALGRLGQHFLEVLRGLSTLKIFGRDHAQIDTLLVVGEQYRKRTMKVLGVSFLSGFALELGASLSVALMAVSIGFRLIDNAIPLSIGLFVLLLAPEAYLPMRNVGANFHAAAEGVLASESILDAIELARNNPEQNSEQPDRAEDLHDLPAIATGLTVLIGPSGSGKTTRLMRMKDSMQPHETAWLPQSNIVVSGTVLENILGPGSRPDSLSAERLDLVHSAMRMAALDDLTLESEVGEAGLAISGGQRQRLGLARAFARQLQDESSVLLLDEPISAVDAERADQIIASLKSVATAGGRVVAASHQPALIAAADTIVEVAHAN